MSMVALTLIIVIILNIYQIVYSASDKKQHTHAGVLKQFDGKHLAYDITNDQLKQLNKGDPVVLTESTGKAGAGLVIQDIAASPELVMDQIINVLNYPKVVPNVKSVSIYEEEVFQNGTRKRGLKFTVGVSLLTFGYFITTTQEPKYNTFYWNLDYKYLSDFDDNIGQWQVLPHPTKSGWSRVMYSVGVKLYSWIPNFVITFLTNTALIESTTWVKKESENSAKLGNIASYKGSLKDVSNCFYEDVNGAHYDPNCANEGKSRKREKEL